MKTKKGVFANSSTGYGKSRNTPKGVTKPAKEVQTKDRKCIKDVDAVLKKCVEEDKDLNSGFGDYLRSPEAVEMMKLFVFANTVMVILTMAWPNIREFYYVIMQWFSEFTDN